MLTLTGTTSRYMRVPSVPTLLLLVIGELLWPKVILCVRCLLYTSNKSIHTECGATSAKKKKVCLIGKLTTNVRRRSLSSVACVALSPSPFSRRE
uniref:Uncharacterized protein n=1 Tax=Anopheles darlingi TaxID=43151 RepID=A0A2M4D7G7_ANODA